MPKDVFIEYSEGGFAITIFILISPSLSHLSLNMKPRYLNLLILSIG
jgi:hypothetical protein